MFYIISIDSILINYISKICYAMVKVNRAKKETFKKRGYIELKLVLNGKNVYDFDFRKSHDISNKINTVLIIISV